MDDPTPPTVPCGFCGHAYADHFEHPTRASILARRRAGRPFCHCCGS